MSRILLLATLALSLASCNTLTNSASLKGKYKRIGENPGFMVIKDFELTDTKFVMMGLIGEQAMDYTVEDGYLYAGPKGSQMRFQIIGRDTLHNEGLLEGTYVRVNQ